MDGRVCVLVLAALAAFAIAAPPQVVRATYQKRSATIEGTHINSAIFQMEFDQEIYHIDNWPCPCDATVRGYCPTSRVVNDTGEGIPLGSVPVTELQRDVYANMEVPQGELTHFHFNLDPVDFVDEGCPIVIVDIRLVDLSAFIYGGAGYIPSATAYDWFKVSWANSEGWWSCPSRPFWGWGDWYVTVVDRSSGANNVTKFFDIRWRTLEVPTCTPLPPRIEAPGPSDDWQLLEESRPVEDRLFYFEFKYYRFYANTVCANFAVAVRQTDKTEFGDADFYVSLTNERPRVEGDYDWAGHVENDDTVAIANVCSPSGTAPLVFYIGAYNWASGSMGVEITATTLHTFQYYPVHLIPGGAALRGQLMHGALRVLCGNNSASDPDPLEQFRCESVPYRGCDGISDLWKCCSPLRPLMPTTDPTYVNEHNPGNTAVRELRIEGGGAWLGSIRPANLSEPRRLSYAITMSYRTHKRARVYMHHDPSTCRVRMMHMFTNAQGEPVEDVTALEEWRPPCDHETLKPVLVEIKTLIDEMQTLNDYDELRVRHYRITFLSLRDEFVGCKDFLHQFVDKSEQMVTIADQQYCSLVRDAASYNDDPCCYGGAALHRCCSGNNMSIPHTVPGALHTDSLAEECSVGVCAQRAVTAYAQQDAEVDDPEKGCAVAWRKAASSERISLLNGFASECRNTFLGTGDMNGIKCKSDGDCDYNVTCNVGRSRCDYNETHVVRCWAENLVSAPDLAASLFDLWQLAEAATFQRLQEEITVRITSRECVGEDSLDFRDHYKYTRTLADCSDVCYNPDTGLDDEPRCLEAGDCSVPRKCDLAFSPSGVCWRGWRFRRGSEYRDFCEMEKSCNWIDCKALGYDEPTCESQCAIGPPEVCLECDGRDCAATGITDSARCAQGLCTADPSADPASCAKLGSCSLKCANGTDCATQAECEAQAVCVGQELLIERNLTGACFAPFSGDSFGEPFCPPGQRSPEYNFGCIQPQITTSSNCTTQGYLWVSVATNEADCNSSPPACFTSDYASRLAPLFGAYTTKTETECTECKNEFRPVLQWTTGKWTPGTVKPLLWTTKQFSSVRKLQNTLDYHKFKEDVTRAIIANSALAYGSEALCRFSSTMDAMNAIACDCGASARGECYQGGSSDGGLRKISVTRACPYVAENVTNAFFELQVFEDSFRPTDFCQNVQLYLIPASSFEQADSASISSQVFLADPPNKYSIIENGNGAVVGQVLSNGIELAWASAVLEKPVRLCIPVEATIPIAESDFTILALAHQTTDTKWEYLRRAERNGTLVCADIDGPGAYVAAMVADDYFTRERVTGSAQAMAYVSATLYALLFLAAAFQVYHIIRVNVLEKNHTEGMVPAQFFMAAVILVYAVARTVYFSLPPLTDPVESILLFEVPTLLFYVMYTSVLYLWSETIYRVKKLLLRARRTLVFYLYIALNVLLAALFLVFILIFHFTEEDPRLPCQKFELRPDASNRFAVNVAYLIFIAVLSVLLAVVYLIIGLYLVCGPLLRASKFRKQLTIMTSLITATFAAMSIARSVLMLLAAVSNFSVPILAFTFLELLPAFVLVWYIQPLVGNVKRIFTTTRASAISATSKSARLKATAGTHTTNTTNTYDGQSMSIAERHLVEESSDLGALQESESLTALKKEQSDSSVSSSSVTSTMSDSGSYSSSGSASS